MLDSLIDCERGADAGELDFTRWYESPEQMGERLAAATRDALRRARLAPGGAHHAMELIGVVGYYASAPAAGEPRARTVFGAVKAELGGVLIPTLAVMRAWRAAKRVRRPAAPALAALAAATVAAASGSAPPARAAPAGAAAHAGAAAPTGAAVPAGPAAHAGPAAPAGSAIDRDGRRAYASRSLRAGDDAQTAGVLRY
jgi:hypothetical protein